MVELASSLDIKFGPGFFYVWLYVWVHDALRFQELFPRFRGSIDVLIGSTSSTSAKAAAGLDVFWTDAWLDGCLTVLAQKKTFKEKMVKGNMFATKVWSLGVEYFVTHRHFESVADRYKHHSPLYWIDPLPFVDVARHSCTLEVLPVPEGPQD